MVKMNKKYVYMMGGLGNQIFEYAFARFVKETGGAVYLINTSFGRDALRNYKLYHYDVKLPVAGVLSSCIIDKRVRLGIKGIFPWNIYIARNTFEYIGREETYMYKYFYGYFQNSKYVDPYLDELRCELRYMGSFSSIQEELIGKIFGCNSVGIHIRRGDYLENVSVFRVISEKYYLGAMQYAREKLRNPQFFVFSDDIGWCKGVFPRVDDIHFIDETYHNTDVDDFEILRRCKHFIIGNSTFSWWTSKLSEAKSKLLIAPEEWFTDADLNLKCVEGLLSGYVLM